MALARHGLPRVEHHSASLRARARVRVLALRSSPSTSSALAGSREQPVRSAPVAAASKPARQPTTPASAEGEPRVLNMWTMSQSLREMEYAVRGAVAIRAEQIEAQLESGKGAELPFQHITFTNIGNPQAVGQKPITFFRQVLALCDLPAESGIDHPDARSIFPADAIARAREMKTAMGPGDTGAYSSTQGVPAFRKDVANFISHRDGFPCDVANVFLTNGASAGIRLVMTALVSSPTDSVLTPLPQYPIYSGLLSLLGAHQAGYELDEARDWAISEESLQKAVDTARAAGRNPRACVIINPGNPTGNVFTRETLQTVVRFCVRERLVLLADEVYQENVYEGAFLSVRRVALEMGAAHLGTPPKGAASPGLELFSFHSTSKGLLGECGKRGGYMELLGIDPYVQSQLFKLASSGLCAALQGQALTSLMVRPPSPSDESYPLYSSELRRIKEALAHKAKLLVDGLRTIEGFGCNDARGAMYAFPSVKLPPKAIAAAQERGQQPDEMYALSLLEGTGICVVPASGFGQAEGRHGFRTTFLPSAEQLEIAVEKIRRHHQQFCLKYA